MQVNNKKDGSEKGMNRDRIDIGKRTCRAAMMD
jgi:hypothetical protein